MDLGKAQLGGCLSWDCSPMVAGAGTVRTGAPGGFMGPPPPLVRVASVIPLHSLAWAASQHGGLWAIGGLLTLRLRAPGQLFQQAKQKERCLWWPSCRSHILYWWIQSQRPFKVQGQGSQIASLNGGTSRCEKSVWDRSCCSLLWEIQPATISCFSSFIIFS